MFNLWPARAKTRGPARVPTRELTRVSRTSIIFKDALARQKSDTDDELSDEMPQGSKPVPTAILDRVASAITAGEGPAATGARAMSAPTVPKSAAGAGRGKAPAPKQPMASRSKAPGARAKSRPASPSGLRPSSARPVACPRGPAPLPAHPPPYSQLDPETAAYLTGWEKKFHEPIMHEVLDELCFRPGSISGSRQEAMSFWAHYDPDYPETPPYEWSPVNITFGRYLWTHWIDMDPAKRENIRVLWRSATAGKAAWPGHGVDPMLDIDREALASPNKPRPSSSPAPAEEDQEAGEQVEEAVEAEEEPHLPSAAAAGSGAAGSQPDTSSDAAVAQALREVYHEKRREDKRAPVGAPTRDPFTPQPYSGRSDYGYYTGHNWWEDDWSTSSGWNWRPSAYQNWGGWGSGKGSWGKTKGKGAKGKGKGSHYGGKKHREEEDESDQDSHYHKKKKARHGGLGSRQKRAERRAGLQSAPRDDEFAVKEELDEEVAEPDEGVAATVEPEEAEDPDPIAAWQDPEEPEAAAEEAVEEQAADEAADVPAAEEAEGADEEPPAELEDPEAGAENADAEAAGADEAMGPTPTAASGSRGATRSTDSWLVVDQPGETTVEEAPHEVDLTVENGPRGEVEWSGVHDGEGTPP